MTTATTSHPMDHIDVRPLRFAVSDVDDADLVWSRSSPEFSMFINALGVHVPYFERFLVAVMRKYRDELDDPQLLADVKSIIGQEAHHAFNFVRFNERMAQTYPGIGKCDADAKHEFEHLLEHRDQRYHIGFTAGYETFTFLAGAIILDRYDELMADADPSLRALWVWHQVEEVEHGAVAFDFYQAFYENRPAYRRWMVFSAFVHIALATAKAYHAILRVERPSLQGKLKGWRFFGGFAWDLFVSSLPVYWRGYHPRKHPICNDAQNRVATAWRAYYASGADAQHLDNATMAEIRA